MKGKNNKGFTLVEVIAVVTILGILVVLAVPRLVDLFNTSRNKVYIEDALRLVSQAKYTMNAKSVDIEKPESGEVIVFSMSYLNSADFKEPPNGGSYLTDSSFVVVRNKNGEYYYSVMLVEYTKKQQYIGVEFSTEGVLSKKDAVKHVRSFSQDELAYLHRESSEANNGNFIDANYINNQLHAATGDTWHFSNNDIIGYYDEEIEEPDAVTDTLAPKITAKFSKVGSLKTTLTIQATDADNQTSELKVFVKVSHDEDDTFPNPLSQAGQPYGNGTSYNVEINFGNHGFNYDSSEVAYVYIIVADPNNNYAQKKLTYNVHQNVKPTIQTYSIARQPSDNHNMPQALVTLDVLDDLDNPTDLKICFSQDVKVDNCPSYKKYSEYFGSGNTYTYTFQKEDGTEMEEPDGSSHKLYVYVKDSSGLKTRGEVEYTLYLNQKPHVEITSFNTSCAYLVNGVCQCSGANCNSLTVGVNLTVSDDITEAGNLQLKLYQKKNDVVEGLVQMPYAQFQSGNRKYTFSGKYDGNSRTLYAEVVDEYGKTDSTSFVLSGVYLNSPPVITKTAGKDFITSLEKACPNCNGDGSYAAQLNFSVSDDITPAGDIKVCVSENAGDCDQSHIHTSKFVSYSSFNSRYTFTHPDITNDLIYPSPAITKKLYIAIVDGDDNYVPYNDYRPESYRLYSNEDPTIHGNFQITSSSSERNLCDVSIDIDDLDIQDDFDQYSVRFCYSVEDIDTCTSYQSLSGLKSALESFRFTDVNGDPFTYNGQTIDSFVQVKDNYGKTATSSVQSYSLYGDGTPTIQSFSIQSKSDVYQDNVFDVKFKAVDYEDTYSICITDQNTCSDSDYLPTDYNGSSSQEYTITVDGREQFGWKENYTEENPEKTITLFVKDSHGNVVHTSADYHLYVLCSNSDNMTLSDEPIQYEPDPDSDIVISPDLCEGMCYHHVETTSNTSHPNHWVDTNNFTARYQKTLTYLDNVVGYTCSKNSLEDLYCNHVDCFATGDASTVNPNVIGLKLYDEDDIWYYSNSKIQRKFDTNKEECTNVPSNSYFYPGDYRCENNESLCDEKSTNYCTPIVDQALADFEEEKQTLLDQYQIEFSTYQIAKENMIYTIYMAIYYQTGYSGYDMEQKISDCMSIQGHLDDSDWLNNYYGICADYENCKECMGTDLQLFYNRCQSCLIDSPYTISDACEIAEDPYDGLTADDICGAFLDYDQNLKNICNGIRNETTCNQVENWANGLTMQFLIDGFQIPGYDGDLTQNLSYDVIDQFLMEWDAPPKEPLFLTQEEYDRDFSSIYQPMGYTTNDVHIIYDREANLVACKAARNNTCSEFYNFCNSTEYTTYKQTIDCNSSGASPIYCRSSDISDGYCLTNDSTCNDSDPDCVKVCYKDVDCTKGYETNPLTFVCQGYYKTFEAKRVDGYIALQESPLRVCPEFYNEFYFYEYEPSSPTAYIKFNPDEIGG